MTEPRAAEPPTPAPDDAPQPGRTARPTGGQDGDARPPGRDGAARGRAEDGDARGSAEGGDGLGPGWHPA